MNNQETQGESLGAVPNIKPLSEWSDEELTLKIATLLGWSNARTNEFGFDLKMIPPDSITNRRCNAPDFASDLNAMHEAEATLNIMQLRQMTICLHDVMTAAGSDYDWIPVCFATARHHAEAFVSLLTDVPSPQSTSNDSPEARGNPKTSPVTRTSEGVTTDTQREN